MGTLIDELFVRIGLDADGFDKENAKVLKGFQRTKDSASDSLKTIEGSAKKTADYLSTVKTEVIGLFLAFAGAKSVTGFILDTINATAQVGRMGSVLGQNKNTINAWGDAFERAGGQADDAQRVFGKITGMIAEFKMNPQALLGDGSLQRPGFKSATEFRDPEEVLLHLADQFQARMADAAKSNDPKGAKIDQEAIFRKLAGEKFGLSDNDIFLIEKGRAAITKQVEAFKVQDRVTEEDAKAAVEFNAALVDLKKTLTGLTRGPLMDFIVDFQKLLDAMTSSGLFGRMEDLNDALNQGSNPWERGKLIWEKFSHPHVNKPPRGENDPHGNFLGARAPWVDTPASNGKPPHGGKVTVGNVDRIAIATDYLERVKGFPHQAALGAAAGLYAESKLDPHNPNPDSGALGIGQWLGPRKKEMIARYGPNPTWIQQLDFVAMEYERNSALKHRLFRSRDAREASRVHDALFERPQGKSNEHLADLYADYRRASAAIDAYEASRRRPAAPHPNAHPNAHPTAHPAPAAWHAFPRVQIDTAMFAAAKRTQSAHLAARQHRAAKGATHHTTNMTTHVTVNGHGKTTEHVGREIANSVHKNLKKRNLAVHANTGLD